MKKCLITGISGQDGSYLAEFLLKKGYEVHGVIRKDSFENKDLKLKNIENIIDKVKLHVGAIDNHLNIYKIIQNVLPDEFYHLAASSFVSYSFEDENYILSQNFLATHYILSTLKELKPSCKIYFAGSSEMFGNVDSFPQNEMTAFNPRSIYGISKLSSYYLVKNYRTLYNMFACTGIMYNHESCRRGLQFVTRKITSSAAKIKLGIQKEIILGNVEAIRDWGYAPDYVEVMWKMLNHNHPDDYVIATGKVRSVYEFASIAFDYLGLNLDNYLKCDAEFFRPSEKIPLCGNSTKALEILGWEAIKPFHEIVEEMVENDLSLLS